MELNEREAIIKDILKQPLERDLQTMTAIELSGTMKVVSAEFIMCNDIARLDRFTILDREFNKPEVQKIVHLGLSTFMDDR